MVKRILISIVVLFSLAGIAHAECVTRFFVLPASQIHGYKADLLPDGDLLSISSLKAIKYPYPVTDGRYIVKAELPSYLIQDMLSHCADFGISDPLTLEGVKVLGIEGSFAGCTREEVLIKFPELTGEIKVGMDEEGEPLMQELFPHKKWACE